MKTVALLVISMVLVIGTPDARSQSDPVFDAKGFQQDRDYFSRAPFEHIDMLSGGLVLTFTDLTLPGNAGFNLTFQRTYNSKPPGSWTFGIAGVPLSVVNPDGPPNPYPPNAPPGFGFPIVFGEDGSEH